MDSEAYIERLRKGIQAADANGDKEGMTALAAEYRKLIGSETNSTGASSEAPNAAPEWTVGKAIQNYGHNVESSIRSSLGQDPKDTVIEAPENFKSGASELYKGNINPETIAEGVAETAAPDYAASWGLKGIGAGVGGLVGGPIGAAIGGIGLPAAYQALRTYGPTIDARNQNDGDETSNTDRAVGAATALGSGILEGLVPGSGKAITRPLKELVTEAGQSVTEQVGGSAGTDAGVSVDPRQVAVEGALGLGGSVAVDGTAHVVGKTAAAVTPSRTDEGPYDDGDAVAHDLLLKAADGDREALFNNNDEGDSGTNTRSFAITAEREARGEIQSANSRLNKLFSSRGDEEGKTKVTVLNKIKAHKEGHFSETSLNELRHLAGPDPQAQQEVERIRIYGQALNKLSAFTKPGGNIGGLRKKLKGIDITDPMGGQKRLLGGQLTMPGIGLAMVPGINVAAAKGVVAGTVINRTGRLVDLMTNRGNPLKRYVESVEKHGTTYEMGPGGYATDTMKREAQEAFDKRVAAAEALKAAKAQVAEDKDPFDPKVAKTEDKLTAQRLREASLKKLKGINTAAHMSNTEALFSGQGKLQNVAAHVPYIGWKAATGLEPGQIAQVIAQLEQGQKVAPGTAQRFREDPRSFSTDGDTPEGQATYTTQEAVRQAANPEYQNTEALKAFKKKDYASLTGAPVDQSNGPDQKAKIQAKLKEATKRPIATNRFKQKAAEGDRRFSNLLAEIEAGGLKPEQEAALMRLVDDINDPMVTRQQRAQIVAQVLPTILPGRALRKFWQAKFDPLASIGNDESISKKKDEAQTKAEEQETKARKVKKKGKQAKEPVKEDTGPQTILQKLLEGPKEPLLLPPPSTSSADIQAESPKPVKVPGNRKSLADQVETRMGVLENAIHVSSSNAPDQLKEYVSKLPDNADGRVERIIYSLASDRITVNQLIDKYAKTYGTDPVTATAVVADVLNRWQGKEWVTVRKQFMQDRLVVDGKVQRDEDGAFGVRHVEVIDPVISENLETAKAINLGGKLVKQGEPPMPYDQWRTQTKTHSAFKKPMKFLDPSFEPMFKFLNWMRTIPSGVSGKMLDQIEEGLKASKGAKNATPIQHALKPKAGQKKNPITGKYTRTADDTPMMTAAQLLVQLKEDRDNPHLFQEWEAGANLRVYSTNSVAQSQGGDLMKGIIRAPQKSPLKDQSGVDFLFHSFGNLLGYDKKSPLVRRQALLNDPEGLMALLRFAEAPFAMSTHYNNNSTNQPKEDLAKLLDEGEGFFQVLNVANEVKALTDWVAIRHPGGTLADPEVQADLVNYETDFIAQLDANNNSYQLVGLLTGYKDLLQATGLMEPEGVADDFNPDTAEGADVYMQPALAIAERIPEIAQANLKPSKLRKLFKNPISNFIYSATFNSRRQAFINQMIEQAGDETNIFGAPGSGSLFEYSPDAAQAALSEMGQTFSRQKYDNLTGDADGEPEAVQKRVVKKEKDFRIESLQKEGWKATLGSFDDEKAALSHMFTDDLVVRMNRELVRDLNTRYPRLREYLGFSKMVTDLAKNNGLKTVVVPTPDGMLLECSLSEDDIYEGIEAQFGEDRVRLGVRSGETKLSGTPLAAFIAHMHDAFVMRETHRRMLDSGGLNGYNAIHDSFGTHPSDTKRLQETVLQVMQELGNPEYNIFQKIIEANGLQGKQLLATQHGLKEVTVPMPQRDGVTPRPASRIPTAVS
jgi:hypothetical protein